MKAWWQSLNLREKRLVGAAGGLVFIALLWTLVWKPLLKHHQLLQEDLQDAMSINAELQQQRAAVFALRNGGGGDNETAPANTTVNLHSAVITLLKRFQLDGAGTSTEEKDKNTVLLKLDSKSFDALAQFLINAERQYAAYAVSMDLTPTAKSGTVNANITLKR